MQPNVRMALNPHELPATTIRVLRFFFAAHARRGGLQNAGRTTVRRNRIRPRGSRSFQLVELSPRISSRYRTEVPGLLGGVARCVGNCGRNPGTGTEATDGCFRFLWAFLLRRPRCLCGSGKIERQKLRSLTHLLSGMPQSRTLEEKFRCCPSRQNCPRRAHRDDCFITSFSLNATITGSSKILWRANFKLRFDPLAPGSGFPT